MLSIIYENVNKYFFFAYSVTAKEAAKRQNSAKRSLLSQNRPRAIYITQYRLIFNVGRILEYRLQRRNGIKRDNSVRSAAA